MSNETLSKYGKFFEERFVTSLVTDSVFAEKCVDGFDLSHIDCEYLQVLTGIIFKHYGEYRAFPNVETLGFLINSDIKDKTTKHLVEDFLGKCRTESPADLQFVKDKSIEFMRNRAMKHAIHDSFEMVKAELYDDIPKRIERALNLFTANDIGHDYFNGIEYRTSSAARECVPTPWPELNCVLKAHADEGGLGNGELGVIVAPTGVGKSFTLVCIGAEAIRRGKTVVHYTMELHAADVGLRYDSCLTGIPINSIIQHKDRVSKELLKYSDSRLIIKEYPTKGATIQTLERHLELLRRNRIFPDLLIVDYADLLKIPKTDQRHKDLEENNEELRRIAGEWQFPLWTASQGNRSTYGERVFDLTGIADSYGKACVGDVVICLSRTQQDKIIDSGRFNLTKNRAGKDGLIFPAHINLSICDIRLEAPETVIEVEERAKVKTKQDVKAIFNEYKVRREREIDIINSAKQEGA